MNWYTPLFALMIAALMLMVAHTSLASSDIIHVCKYADDTTEYTGSNYESALRAAANACVNNRRSLNGHLAALDNENLIQDSEDADENLALDCVNETICSRRAL